MGRRWNAEFLSDRLLVARVVGFRRLEVVCSAVRHRDYRIAGASVRIMVFADRIERVF